MANFELGREAEEVTDSLGFRVDACALAASELPRRRDRQLDLFASFLRLQIPAQTPSTTRNGVPAGPS